MPLFLTYQSRKRAAVQQSWDEQEVPVGGQGIKHFQEKNTTNGFVRNDSDTNLHETELTYKVGQLHVDAMPTLNCVIPFSVNYTRTMSRAITTAGWPAGTSLPTLPYFLHLSPVFRYFLRKQP